MRMGVSCVEASYEPLSLSHCNTAGTCRSMINRASATHLSMYNNGHITNQPQEMHLENFDGQLHSLHCGYKSLKHNCRQELCR